MGARAGGKVWPYHPSRRMGKEQEILLQTGIPLSHQVELLPQEGKTLKLESRKKLVVRRGLVASFGFKLLF